MKRSARRRSRRYQAIFRRNPQLRLLRASIIAALGVGAVGCTVESGGSDDAAIDAALTTDGVITADIGPDGSAPPPGDAAPLGPDAAPPAVDAAPPEADAAPPEPDAAPPEVDAAPPEVDAAPPEPDAAPPEVDAAPPEPDAAPPEPDAAPPMGACEDPVPVLGAGDAPTGIVRCADESMNRVEQVRCQPINMGRACPPEGSESGMDRCRRDADCADGPHGRCIISGPQILTCGCQYACETDDDCADGRFCLCAGLAHSSSLCVSAQCLTNRDCDSGECAVIVGEGGCGTVGYSVCRTPEDACRSYADCNMGAFEGCVPRNDALQCTPLPICGRPLMVAGEERRAESTTRDDWTVEVTPDLSSLSLADRLDLTVWWQGIAALEHASVASFGRFTLELMRYGAPAHLLADTQSAAADEVAHAQMAYGLASAYAGRDLGPGPLDLSDLALSASKAEAVAHLVREACLGETIGAAEARTMAEEATDPAVTAICARIAEEEGRHAVLAWRALQWFLGDDAALIEVASAALNDAIAAHFERPLPDAEGIPAHGLLGNEVRHTLHWAAVESVVLPCAVSLGMSIDLA